MNDPTNPIGWAVWRRGAVLGLIWVVVFFAVTGITYGVMGLAGWTGDVRALCAMGIGPILATIVIVGWWMVRRPTLAVPEKRLPIFDPDRTLVSRQTAPLRAREMSGGEDDEPARS